MSEVSREFGYIHNLKLAKIDGAGPKMSTFTTIALFSRPASLHTAQGGHVATNHTMLYDPFIKRQISSRN